MGLSSGSLRRLNTNNGFSTGLLATPDNEKPIALDPRNPAHVNQFKNQLTSLGVDIQKFSDEDIAAILARAKAEGLSILELLRLMQEGSLDSEFHDPWNRSDAKRNADMALINGVIEELGLSSKKDDIEALAEAGDSRVSYVDANGDGSLNFGEILTLHSQTKGDIKIAVGGDGEINGGDDMVLEQSTITAAGSTPAGLSEVNAGLTATGGEEGALSEEELSSLNAGIMHRAIEGDSGGGSPGPQASGNPPAGDRDEPRKPPQPEGAQA